jgi:hypothetical protein
MNLHNTKIGRLSSGSLGRGGTYARNDEETGQEKGPQVQTDEKEQNGKEESRQKEKEVVT